MCDPGRPSDLLSRTDRAVVDALTNLRLHDLNDCSDERARRVILAAVTPGVAHVLDFRFVEVRELVFLGLGPEAQFVDVVDDFAQVVTVGNLVLNLAEDLADFVFDCIRARRLLRETMEVRKELAVDEIAEIVAGQCRVVVKFPVLTLRRGPRIPAIPCVENASVLLPFQRGFGGLVLFKSIELFQE